MFTGNSALKLRDEMHQQRELVRLARISYQVPVDLKN